MTTMICLASKQPMPNLRPTLCKELSFGVTRVVLVVSDEMKENADRLAGIFAKYQISCEQVAISDVYGTHYLNQEFSKILKDIEGKCRVNLTGGTKMMSLALWRVASRREDTDIFYVRQDNHRGMWLEGGGRGEFNITARLSIKDIFDAHGYDIQNPSSFNPDESQRRFARWLLENYYDKPDIIGLLNRVSHTDNNDKKNIKVCFDKKENLPLIQPILDHAEKVNLLEQHEDHLFFATRNKRKFICGVWLETAVEEILKEIKKTETFIDDIKTGFQAKWGLGETDVLVSRPKGLAIIECKTAAYKRTREINVVKQTAGQKKFGGLTTVNILVSLKKLKNQQALDRAERENIHIIDGLMLGSLKEHLIEYIK